MGGDRERSRIDRVRVDDSAYVGPRAIDGEMGRHLAGGRAVPVHHSSLQIHDQDLFGRKRRIGGSGSA